MPSPSLSEYLFTFGMLVAFLGLIIGAVMDRKNIKRVLKERGFGRRNLAFVILIALLFVLLESFVVKPTQLLFFDDAIYQAMGQSLLHTGQAWMCDYGTPYACYIGEIFHEPIGESFNLAIGYGILGVNLGATYGVGLALGLIAVLAIFFVALLLLNDMKAAYFAELLLALSPVLIVWSMPTNSDVASLAYSLIAMLFLLIFVNKKNLLSLSNMFLSTALVLYMKVNGVLYLFIFLIIYLLLDDKNPFASIKNNLKMIEKNLLNTEVLVVLLLFVIAVSPAIIYSYTELKTGDYGYRGTTIQNTCTNKPITAMDSINIQNFNANLCGNIAFWFNQYKDQYIMQPIIFSALAILGTFLLLMQKRMELLAILVWFVAFFLLYTAFYAGSVLYGVDWRFMLSLVAQTSIAGGFALSIILQKGESFLDKRLGRGRSAKKVVNTALSVILVVVVLYPTYTLLPQFSIDPSKIQQAADARFYEGFVYNNSRYIPNSCLVFSYDPTLFNINNKTSTQLANLYNITFYNMEKVRYSCFVMDYGYWCHTPNNICAYANKTYNLTPIVTATFEQFNYNYGFYLLNKK